MGGPTPILFVLNVLIYDPHLAHFHSCPLTQNLKPIDIMAMLLDISYLMSIPIIYRIYLIR